MTAQVLVIEDEPLLARNVRIFLERKGYNVEIAPTVAKGRALYRESQPDIVLVDHNLPDGTGLSFIKDVRAKDRWTKLVMITAFGGVDIAVSAMKSGADDYLTKPAALDDIAGVVQRLLRQARAEELETEDRAKERVGLARLIGTSPSMMGIKQRVRFLTSAEHSADSSGERPGPPVLITGETGTGKEVIARALHQEGPRAGKPFVAVNCAALPAPAIESELYGYEKGALPGAEERSPGLFGAAEGGTLFLDGVGELPMAQQAKLLKAIEDRAIRPVGSLAERRINIRFVAASSSNLETRARNGEFRSDLLYRLNTVTIDAPPLRDRGDDILILADHFLGELQHDYGRSGLVLSADARKALLKHGWPGNIRELRNVIEQACLMAAGPDITAADLQLRAGQMTPMVPIFSADAKGEGLIDVERRLIIDALRANNGNISVAARALGISRDTLRYRMEKFQLSREEFG